MSAIPRYFSYFAGSTGNSSGTINTTAAHAAETDYYIQPPAGQKWHVHRMIWSLVAAKGFEIEEYGDQTALVGGVSIVVSRNGTEEVLNSGHPFKDNGDLAHVCYDVSWLKWTNTTNEQAVARWSFDKGGGPIVLTSDDKLIVRFLAGSDTSGVTDNHWCFQGVNLGTLD
jgi:hypothetical protein